MFKIGDKVVLLRNEYGHEDLTEGKVYEVIAVREARAWVYVLDDVGSFHNIEFDSIKLSEPEKQSSDGGSTDYYNIPKGAKDIGDLINYKNMNFNIGNVFKACWRKGEKNGVSEEYDLRKMAFFVKSELERIGGKYDDIYK